MKNTQVDRKLLAGAIGCAVMLVLSCAFVFVIQIFILNEYLPTEYTTVSIIISMGLVAFIGANVAYGMDKNGGLEAGIFAVAAYYMLFVFAAIFFFDGLNLQVLYRIVGGICGCGAAILVLMLKKKSPAKRKKRRGNR